MVSGIVGVSLLVVVGAGTSEEGGGGDERGLHYVELKNTGVYYVKNRCCVFLSCLCCVCVYYSVLAAREQDNECPLKE